jgi:hypothetical protein
VCWVDVVVVEGRREGFPSLRSSEGWDSRPPLCRRAGAGLTASGVVFQPVIAC